MSTDYGWYSQDKDGHQGSMSVVYKRYVDGSTSMVELQHVNLDFRRSLPRASSRKQFDKLDTAPPAPPIEFIAR